MGRSPSRRCFRGNPASRIGSCFASQDRACACGDRIGNVWMPLSRSISSRFNVRWLFTVSSRGLCRLHDRWGPRQPHRPISSTALFRSRAQVRVLLQNLGMVYQPCRPAASHHTRATLTGHLGLPHGLRHDGLGISSIEASIRLD